MTSPDTFDLLGISGREDPYTDLLVNAFNLDRQFRDRFLRFVGERPGGGWVAQSRVRVKRADSRQADVPDIVLHNDSTSRIVLVEVKIWSGEGVNQLERYSNPEFSAVIAKRLLGSPKFRSCNLVYLTLDTKEIETRGVFEQKTFDELRAVVLSKGFSGRTRLHGLLRELDDRLAQRACWKPLDSGSLSDLFEGGPSLLSAHERLEMFVRNACGKRGFQYRSGVTNNPQHGQTPLAQVFEQGWSRGPAPGCMYAGSFNVHFEVQWLGDDGMSLEVHYETEPYYTRKTALQAGDEYTPFKDQQSEFIDEFFTHSPAGWKPVRQRGWITCAVLDHGIESSETFWLPPSLSVGEASKLIRQSVLSARGTINSLVR